MNRVPLLRGSDILAVMERMKDDLSERLPPGILADLGRWTRYQSFRAFTWPWLFRRFMLLGPIAILAGFAYGAWHSSGMGSWEEWPGLALRACGAALISVTAGPLLATIIRHLRLPFAIERILVILAIVAGLWIALVALGWASAYHAELMRGHVGRSMDVSLFGQAMSQILYASVNGSTIVLVFAGGGLAALYYVGERRRIAQYAAQAQLSRLRAERDAADMRLSVLQAQVEPHFLFNTLASVRSLIATEPGRAAQTVEALGAYLRATMPRLREADAGETTLDEQIALCSDYLDLMKLRMAGRLAARVEASEAARRLRFPPLILLTLVENAVTHGIEPKIGRGSIAILADVEGDMLAVSVEDDGVGLTPGVSAGLGLANVRAQLLNLFGERAALDLTSRPEGGVRARIRVPAVAQ